MVTLAHEVLWHKGKRWERLPAEPYASWVMGVDLGQSQDYTAVSAIEHDLLVNLGDDGLREAASRGG